jgi:hypothetical protein
MGRVKQPLMQCPPNDHERNIYLFPHLSRQRERRDVSRRALNLIEDILRTCYKRTLSAITKN